MTLAPGTRLGPYEILSTLGAGGMGEVYRARDPQLARFVAIKVLPSLSSDPDRLRRFEQEARAAAALNHPNILSVYQLGTHDGAPYMVSELLEGETLREDLRQGLLPCRKVIDYGAQIADGLSAAHARGIVHRDLKPENLFVSRDGRIKILDFGLAKLLPAQRTADASTLSKLTEPGRLIGTVNYMSPEQVRGQDTDHRADIFALGVILYEALCGQPAFRRTTSADTLSAILREDPPAFGQAVGVPLALDRVVRRCLDKKPEGRFQSASDLAFALRAISDAPGGPVLEKAPDKRKPSRMVLKGGLALAIMATLASLWYLRNRRVNQAIEAEQHESMHIAKVTGSGQVRTGAISPDGKYIVYVLADARRNQSLVLRHVATGQEVTIVVPTRTIITGLTFSRDSNYVYFVSAPEAESAGVLYRITVLGGNPQELVKGTEGAITFSPDDRQMAYLRHEPDKDITHLLVANRDGSNEHVILSRLSTELTMFKRNGALGWSPDGRTLVMVVLVPGRGHADLMTISPDGGSPPQILCSGWALIDSVVWRNRNELIVNGSRNGTVGTRQLWTVSYPGCGVHRITNDMNFYSAVSITADSSSILTVQQTTFGSIWLVDIQGSFRQISDSPSTRDGETGLAWMKDGSLVYTFKIFDNWNLGLMNVVSHRNAQLTTDSHNYFEPYAAPDGQTLIFSSDRGGLPRAIWRMNCNGGAVKRLSASFGIYPIVSDDGKWVLYLGRKDGDYGLLKVPFEGGSAQFVGEKRQMLYPIGGSSDGKLVAGLESNDRDSTWRILMIPVEGGPPAKVSSWIHSEPELEDTMPRLSPDQKQILFVGYKDGVENLWTQDFGGRGIRQLSHFTDPKKIFDFAMASDGRIAVSRGTSTSDIVLINRPIL